MTIPVKALSEIEVKSEVSENDKILILDSVSEEARLASKDELKGDKGDKWDTWQQWPQWVQWLTWPKWDKGDPGVQWPKGDRWEQGIQGPTGLTGNTWPKGDTWAKWDKWDTWASIVWAEFVLNDIKFLKDDDTYVTLADAKTELKWDKWDTWASIVSAEFKNNDIVFTKDDNNTVSLEWAKTTLKWDKGDKWDAATIAVWTVATGEEWSNVVVENVWTEYSAVLNFTIPKGDTWTAATIQVWDVSTWAAWSSASVVNSWTSSAAIFDFSIPKGDKGDKWDKWDKGDWATISVWNVETTAAWTQAEITNSWTSWDAVFNFKIPKWDKWDKWDKGDTGAKWDTGNTWPQWVSVVYFQKISWTWAAWTIDTYEFTLSDTNTFQFSVYNWANGEGSWDMLAAQNLADLTNFETARNNLWVYSKAQVEALISDFWWFKVVSTLPSTNIKTNIIYMKWPIGSGADRYEEWIYSDNTWTKIWETSVDLTNYFNTATQTSDAITEGSSHLFMTTQERTKLSNTSWTNTWDQSASDFDIKDLADSTGLRSTWSNKQNAISDLSTIRSWAAAWATAVQPNDLATIATSGKLEDVTGTADDITEWSTNLFLTSAERTKLGNTSWTNSGDETQTTIKTKLWYATASQDWYLKKEDFATFNWKQDAITNSDDITQGSTNLFMTTAERTKLWNQSWTNTWDETGSSIKTKLWITTLSWANTGDETNATIKTKLWAATASADWYLKKEDFATFNWKQEALVSGSNIKTVKSQSILGSWNININEVPSWWTEWQVLTKGSSSYNWEDASWGSEIVYLTRAEYNALSNEEKMNGTHYGIVWSAEPVVDLWLKFEFVEKVTVTTTWNAALLPNTYDYYIYVIAEFYNSSNEITSSYLQWKWASSRSSFQWYNIQWIVPTWMFTPNCQIQLVKSWWTWTYTGIFWIYKWIQPEE